MSTLNVETITDGTNSVSTSVVTKGVARAWVTWTMQGTQTIFESNNISSITDNGAGCTFINFAQAAPHANYACATSTTHTEAINYSAGLVVERGVNDTTQNRAYVMHVYPSARWDSGRCSFIMFY